MQTLRVRITARNLNRALACIVVMATIFLSPGLDWLESSQGSAASIVVDTTVDEVNSDSDCSLREAIIAANTDTAVSGCAAGSGADVISVPFGTYSLTVTGMGEDEAALGDLDILESVTINGSVVAATIIDGQGADRVFDIAPLADGTIVINEIMKNPAVVDDSNGEWIELFNPTGSAVDINGWTIRDDDIDSHVINNGGPLEVPARGYLVLARESNPLLNGGISGAYEYADFLLANVADEVVLLDVPGLEVDRVDYDDGVTFPDPVGASMALKAPRLENSEGSSWCTSSTTFGDGDEGTPGGVNDCLPDPGTGVSVQMSNLVIRNGSASDGAGIRNYGDLQLASVDVTTNVGIGIYNLSVVSIYDSYVEHNSGAGIDSFSPTGPGPLITMERSEISDNTGSGISAINTTITIEESHITGNGWGGIWAMGSPLSMTESTVSENSTTANGGGLALINVNADEISASTITGNGAEGEGGGIYFWGLGTGGTLALTNTTISGNHADQHGGGIMVGSGTGSILEMSAVTLVNNIADHDDGNDGDGGGIHTAAGAHTKMTHTLIGQNLDLTTGAGIQWGQECVGDIESAQYNLIERHSSSVCTVYGGSNDIIGFLIAPIDPLIGPLQGNGGLTDTHTLLMGSPAIEAGQPGGCSEVNGAPVTADQRGVSRPQGGRCDIGAFEYEYPYSLFLPLIMR